MNEFIKPLRQHPGAKGTELEHDLDVLHGIVRVHAVLLCHLHRSAQDPTFAAEFLGVDSDPARIRAQLTNMNNINRLAFAMQSNFCIEWMLSHISAGLYLGEQQPFGNLVIRVVSILDKPEQEYHKHSPTTLSKIRNTQHNRGVHKHGTESFYLKGVLYCFEQGKSTKCATWDHLAHAAVCALETINVILDKAQLLRSTSQSESARCPPPRC